MFAVSGPCGELRVANFLRAATRGVQANVRELLKIHFLDFVSMGDLCESIEPEIALSSLVFLP